MKVSYSVVSSDVNIILAKMICSPDIKWEYIVNFIQSVSHDSEIFVDYNSLLVDVCCYRTETDIKQFINSCTDLGVIASNGSTPIMFIAQRGFIDIAKYMVDKGVDLYARNKDKYDVLYFAGSSTASNDMYVYIKEVTHIYKKDPKELAAEHQQLIHQTNSLNKKVDMLTQLLSTIAVESSDDQRPRKKACKIDIA